MKVILTAAVALLLLIGAVPAMADSVSTDFESGFTVGESVNGFGGWKALETSVGGKDYDQNVVANDDSVLVPFGQKSLRISSAVASGEFEGWVYSKPVDQPASELLNQGYEAEFRFKALDRGVTPPPGSDKTALSYLSISPTDEHGGRMSYVRLENTASGVQVFFVDNPNHYVQDMQDGRWIATLDAEQTHTITFVMTMVPGDDNDIVNVYVDDKLKACGNTWENYYRYSERDESKGDDGKSPLYLTPTDRLIFQARSASTDFTGVKPEDAGFLIDNVTTKTTAQGEAIACPKPTGPAGAAGTTGANGIAGPPGQTIMTGESAVGPRLIGNTRRVIHVPQRKGERLLSAHATLRNKRLPVHVPHVIVDLRDKVVGNYNVFIVAKYRTKSGKVHVHRTHRSLSVTRALSEARMPA